MLAAAPEDAQEEAWILGTGYEDRLNALAADEPGGWHRRRSAMIALPCLRVSTGPRSMTRWPCCGTGWAL